MGGPRYRINDTPEQLPLYGVLVSWAQEAVDCTGVFIPRHVMGRSAANTACGSMLLLLKRPLSNKWATLQAVVGRSGSRVYSDSLTKYPHVKEVSQWSLAGQEHYGSLGITRAICLSCMTQPKLPPYPSEQMRYPLYRNIGKSPKRCQWSVLPFFDVWILRCHKGFAFNTMLSIRTRVRDNLL